MGSQMGQNLMTTSLPLQVLKAMDFARLTNKLQDERMAVALHYYILGQANLSNYEDLEQ